MKSGDFVRLTRDVKWNADTEFLSLDSEGKASVLKKGKLFKVIDSTDKLRKERGLEQVSDYDERWMTVELLAGPKLSFSDVDDEPFEMI